ncbi:MAG TPA: DUF2796 domain-containing protein [Pseudobdellovibrionaceae bacterium]|nr:DUF2796 domain-containing protein [Pseudobdellovibrionaceae bacterium]
MKKNSVILGVILTSLVVFADKKNEHRHHEAHVHGGAVLNIAFDQLQGKVEFKGASEGVLGFEHEAKTEKDKKKLSQVISQFESGMGSMVKFDASLGCVFSKEKIERVGEENHEDHENQNDDKHHHGEHSDFVALFNVLCKKEIKGTKLTIDFTQFKGVKDLDVTILVGDLQKSIEVQRKPVTVELL